MIKKIIGLLILILFSSYFIEKYISIQSNTLASHESWYSFKKPYKPYLSGIMGSYDFLFERQSLADEKLNLGVWFGYQDVLYKNPLSDFESYKINFNLESNQSYLWVYLNCSNEKCLAFRSSAYADYPSGFYLIKHNGEILQHLATGPLYTPGQHQIKITKKTDLNRAYQLFVDNILIQDLEYNLPFTLVRFRGGYHPVAVQNIEIIDLQKKSTNIDFKSDFNINRFFAALIILMLLSIVIFFIQKEWNSLYLCNMVLAFLAVIVFSFDNYYWSNLYATGRVDPTYEKKPNFIVSLEKYRKNLFVNKDAVFRQKDFLNLPIWFEPFQTIQQMDLKMGVRDFQIIDKYGNTKFIKSIDEEIIKYNTEKYLKIAFIGGSQTWGAGATGIGNTFGSLIIKDLTRKTKRKVVGINFAMCGGVLYDFIERADLISKFRPDLLIVNFGANDSPTIDSDFRHQMKEFIDKIKQKKINTLFSIEALSHEYTDHEPKKARIIREFASQHNINIVSLHNYISSSQVRDSGLLWNDLIHYTDFGHMLASQFFINTDSYKNLTSK